MTDEQIINEMTAEINALTYLLAATLARTFEREADLRTWCDNASHSALIAMERRPNEPTAELYRAAFDRIVAQAITLHPRSR